MSTNWGYVCLSHDPHIRSEHWFNHGDDLLREIWDQERAGTWPDVRVGGEYGWDEPAPVVRGGGYETNSPIVWLREHPRCEIGLHNEYGDYQTLGSTITIAVREELQRALPGVPVFTRTPVDKH